MAGISPLVSMQLAGVALEGLSLRFNNYVDMLIKAVPDITKVQRVSILVHNGHLANNDLTMKQEHLFNFHSCKVR